MDIHAENCAKCGCLPDDILTLTCNHDLCLPCAAKNLRREMTKYGESTKAIMCELCGAPTILDDSSVEELLKAPPAETGRDNSQWGYSPNRPYSGYPSPGEATTSKIQRSPYIPNQETAKYAQGENTATERIGTLNDKKNMRSFCIEHPDEEISYFCFDCLSNCVCAECVIHGPHKTHDVLTVKKSYGIVKSKVEEILSGLTTKLDEERMLEDKFANSQREMRDNNKLLKKQVGDVFQEIRNRVDKKEKEILSAMDTALEDALNEVDSFVKTLENKAAGITGTYDLVRNHLTARDEVLLLNFYANNHLKLKQQIESEEINFMKIHESYVPKVPMNFSEVIDSLNILQVQISAVGNVGSEKFRNYPASVDYTNAYGDYESKENKSRPRKELGRKDNMLNTVSPIGNRSQAMVGGAGQKGYLPDNQEKNVRTGNFRNFQNAPSRTNETRNSPYLNTDKYK